MNLISNCSINISPFIFYPFLVGFKRYKYSCYVDLQSLLFALVTMREYKIVVMGSGGVGKSCLTIKFVTGQFKETYDPTIEDFYRKEVELENIMCVLEILDTAGTEQFSTLLDLYILNGQGFLLVYSVGSTQSYIDAQPLREKIFKIRRSKTTPLVLVGNKCDMLMSEREVQQKDAAHLAANWLCPFFECSAKTNQNVDITFYELAKLIMRADRPKKLCCSIL